MGTVLDAGNVVVGTANGPGIWRAPIGTAKPATATEAWGAGWETLGYLDEEAEVELNVEMESEALRAWQSRSPIRTIITGKSLTLGLTMIEFTPITTALFFGEAEPLGTDEEFTLTVTTDSTPPEYLIGIDTQDGDAIVRYIFDRATLSSTSAISLAKAKAQGLPVVLSALDNAGTLATIIRGIEVGS